MDRDAEAPRIRRCGRRDLEIYWEERMPLKERITFWRNLDEVCMGGGREEFEEGDSYGLVKLRGHCQRRHQSQRKIQRNRIAEEQKRSIRDL